MIRHVAVASMLAVVLALPTGAAAQAPAGDSVTGNGTVRFVSGGFAGLTQAFDVDIRAGRNGENPTGTLTLLFTFTDPTCLVIGGPVEEPPTATVNLLNPVTGGRAVFQLGSIGGVQFIAVAAADSPDDCSLGSASRGGGGDQRAELHRRRTGPADLAHGLQERRLGSVRLHEAGPVHRVHQADPGPGPYPSSRAACQHGGWAQYGFKSKRRCLRFVRLTPSP